MEKAPEAPPNEDCRQKLPQFKGTRLRKWGRWGSEIRMPKTRVKIWLGSYKTAEQAARAYDAAVYCLRGPNAKFNFPESVPAIPSASSLSRQQIQVAAAKYALDEIPSASPSLQNINHKAREEQISLSQPSSISEMELACDSQQIPEARDLRLWESPFDGNRGLKYVEKIPSIDEVSAWEFMPSCQEEQQEVSAWEFMPSWKEEQQQGCIFSDPTDLWNFLDI